MRPLILFICLQLCVYHNHAQPHKNLRKEFSFTIDNDAFLLQIKDAYYTNGIFLAFRFADTHSIRKKVHAIEVGQMIFTPLSKKANTNDIDRPYCGYLFTRYQQTNEWKNDAILQWHGTLGVVGSASLGQALQDQYHNLFNFRRFEGWNYQVRNAIGIDAGVSLAATAIQASNFFKIVPAAEANLGSTFINAKVGAMIVMGSFEKNNHSILFNNRVSHSSATAPKNTMEWIVYAYPSISLQGYNATLQGGLFNKGSGAILATPNRFLWEQHYGIAYAQGRVSTRFEIVRQSRETAIQAYSQTYGSFQLGLRMF